MQKDLRILHLEDIPEDMELVDRQLRRAGFAFTLQHVTTRDAFRQALEVFRPDIVLADYSLPDFDGLSAIQLTRRRDPDLPIIMVTGILGDEAAVKVIKAGANDFILKDRLARLPMAVKRAVEEAEQSRSGRRAELELHSLNAELEQRVVLRTIELQEANRVKDELIASERAVCLELEQLRSREVEVGLRIQQSLLFSQPPDIPGLEIAALTVPSQGIDGDFYIFITHNDRLLDVVVGDVMGKGVAAALLAAATKMEFFRAVNSVLADARSGELPQPKDIVTLAHAQIVHQLIELESFVTLCHARLDLDRRVLSIVDCGHTGIIHWHPTTGRCEMLHGDNLPLGIREGEIFDQISVPFEPGDVLLFFSDGITEARNAAGELFGVERLTAHVEANAGLEPALLADSIRQAVGVFAGLTRLKDDLTSVAVRAKTRPRAPEAHAGIEIRSDLRELRQVRHFVREFCEALGDPVPGEGVIDALVLAATEAASNIMLHSCYGRSDQSIHMEAVALPEEIALKFRHVGAGFDPAIVAPTVLDGTRESGFGTYIIARSVDEVRYSRDERGRNCVALTKHRNNGQKGMYFDGTGNR
jgi:sigma-B regulation protein RsbU (phosphoserine phosphatase)